MIGQTMDVTLSMRQEQIQNNEALKFYIREALKAFKKVTIQNRSYYTCNVERLKNCNRLGDERQVTMWKTHFFLRSRHFDGVLGVVFNSAPGTQLASFSRDAVDEIYVSVTPREILDPRNGERIFLEEDLIFASAREE